MPDRRPTVVEWAQGAYQQYTELAGAGSWGVPTCSDPAAATVQCSWLQTDAAPTLQLVNEGDTWRVSHPVFARAGEPAAVGSGCVVGSDNVNFRGGPGTSWPRFAQIPPGSCNVTVFDAVESDPIEGDQWRYVEFNGQRGWIVDRVVQILEGEGGPKPLPLGPPPSSGSGRAAKPARPPHRNPSLPSVWVTTYRRLTSPLPSAR